MTRKRHMTNRDKVKMLTTQLENAGMFVEVDEAKKHVVYKIKAQLLASATDAQLRPLYEKCLKLGEAYR